MAPTATNATANGVAKSGGEVRLSSADVMQMEHEYGAHKYVMSLLLLAGW